MAERTNTKEMFSRTKTFLLGKKGERNKNRRHDQSIDYEFKSIKKKK